MGLCCPVMCPSSQPAEQCSGRAGAGSRLGEVLSLAEGLHLQNTACKENHLLDRSEELFPDVREGSKRTGMEAERRLQQSVLCFGCLLAALWCSFCFASLQMGKTLCQSLCCGWESGAWKHPCISHTASAVVGVGAELEECKGLPNGSVCFSSSVFALPGKCQAEQGKRAWCWKAASEVSASQM